MDRRSSRVLYPFSWLAEGQQHLETRTFSHHRLSPFFHVFFWFVLSSLIWLMISSRQRRRHCYMKCGSVSKVQVVHLSFQINLVRATFLFLFNESWTHERPTEFTRTTQREKMSHRFFLFLFRCLFSPPRLVKIRSNDSCLSPLYNVAAEAAAFEKKKETGKVSWSNKIIIFLFLLFIYLFYVC